MYRTPKYPIVWETTSGISSLLLTLCFTYMVNVFTLMKRSTVKFVKAFPVKSIKQFVIVTGQKYKY